MDSQINCKVDNCNHWNNWQCSAEDVKINMEISEKEACSPDVTYCETFKPKEC